MRQPLLRTSVCTCAVCAVDGGGHSGTGGVAGVVAGDGVRERVRCGCAHVSPRYVGIGITERFFCPLFRAQPVSNRAAPVSNRAPPVSDRPARFNPRPARFKPARRFKPRPARFKPARRFKPRPARFKTPGAVSFPGPNRHGFASSHDNLTSQVGECRVELDSPQLQS